MVEQLLCALTVKPFLSLVITRLYTQQPQQKLDVSAERQQKSTSKQTQTQYIF